MIRQVVFLAILPVTLWAAPPQVMTDIAPVHSLTAQVMGELGTPDLLLPPDADPHDFALRPSDAHRLSEADLVIWVGSGLTPWLKDPLDTLATDAAQLALLDAPGWDRLELRDISEHGTDHQDASAHGGHDHSEFDPHGWLDPVAARAWVSAISEALSTADPDNAATYESNASAILGNLSRLETEIATQMTPLRGAGYILPHDGYQYFEQRFGLSAAGTIADADGRTPGPAHIAELRDEIAHEDIICVFNDVEIGDRWAALVTEGTEARTGRIDAVGAGLQPGPDLYSALLHRLANAFETCLADK